MSCQRIIAPVCGSVGSGRAAPEFTEQALVLIPTALQELSELRIDSGEKAVLADGTMSEVYVTNTPADGNTYLNLHLNVATEAKQVVLHKEEIRLEGAAASPANPPIRVTRAEATPPPAVPLSYTPLDWFLDTGKAEVHTSPLTVTGKAIVQFTIEVPRMGLDDLTLFVRSQRVGTIREIRAEIAGNGKSE